MRRGPSSAALCARGVPVAARQPRRPEPPPEEPASPYPRASAVIAAYLPNEAVTLLLVGREIYPWLPGQMFPIIAFLIWRDGGAGSLDWMVPVFVVTTLLTASVGPAQTLFAHRLATPEVLRHGSWFLRYLLVSSLFYTELRNVIARVAHLEELAGEREWRVTPRQTVPWASSDTTTKVGHAPE
jgi:hypothetical protein